MSSLHVSPTRTTAVDPPEPVMPVEKPTVAGGGHDRRLGGTVMGLLAALGYTLTNVSLRQVIHCDSVWVSCVKAMPNLLFTLPFVVWHRATGRELIRQHRDVLIIVGAATIAQLGGNVLFQISLTQIGLAVTVPVTLSSVIVGSTTLGRFFLREAVTARTLTSIAIVLASIVVLSLGADAAYDSVQQSQSGSGMRAGTGGVLMGFLAAVVAGFAYSTLGATIRWSTTRGTPLSTILCLVGCVGVLGLGSLATSTAGTAALAEATRRDWAWMITAGVFNAGAFFALALAMRWSGLVYVNLLNGSQAAMAAVLGVVIFHEALTWPLATGVLLAVLGLANLRGKSSGSLALRAE